MCIASSWALESSQESSFERDWVIQIILQFNKMYLSTSNKDTVSATTASDDPVLIFQFSSRAD